MISPFRSAIGFLLAASPASATPTTVSVPVSAIAAPNAPSPSNKATALPTSSPARAGAQAAVHLNHFFVTLDAAGYSAVRDSAFLKEQFGVYEMRTTKRGDRTYTGQYFYGDQTYFELFEAAGRATPQSNGLAFGVDAVGDAKKVAPTIGESLITRELHGEQVPWFKMGTLPIADASAVVSWIMEYVPEFLTRWNPQTGTPGGVTREAVLHRYAAALNDTQATKLLQNVTGLDFTLSLAERDNLVAKARGFGATVEQQGDVTVVRTAQEELRLTLGDANKITAAHYKLRKKVPAAEHRFGSTVLHINADATATWTF
jgi:hypothetical protein